MDYVRYVRQMVGHNKIIMNAAGAIIVKDGKILLQRRSDNGKWGLIGGIMEIGETYAACALREVREETGLDIRLGHLVGIYHSPDHVFPSGDEAHVICAIYAAEIVSGEPKIDEESLELRFFDPNEMPEVASMDHRQALRDYFAGLKNQVK